MPDVDPVVTAAIAESGRADVIVTFERPPTDDDLIGFDVKRRLSIISAAALTIDAAALERLVVTPEVLRVELDGEVRALGDRVR